MLKHLFLKNHKANFNQTWQETCLEDGDSDLFKQRGWPLLGPNKGQNKGKKLINIQKSSSHEPPIGWHWYLVWRILGAKRFKFVQIKSIGSCMIPPQGL